MHSVKRRRFLPLLIGLALVLAACGDNTATTNTTASSPAANGSATTAPAASGGAKTELTMGVFAGVDEAKELQAIIDKVNATATDYHVTVQASPQEFYTKIQTGFASGTAPDLLWLDQDHLPGYADKGSLLDITDRVAKDDKTKHPASDMSDYFDAAKNASLYKGKMFGLPWLQQPLVMYVNTDLFKAAGLALPTADWTWADFLNDAQKLTIDTSGKTAADAGFNAKATKQWGFTTNSDGWPPLQMYVWQNGGDLISSDFKTSPIDSTQTTGAAQWYADLLLKYHVSPTASQVKDQGFDTMFTAGKVAMFVGGAADAIETRDTMKGTALTYVVPKGPGGNRATPAGIYFTAINAKTKNADAAYNALMDINQGIDLWKVPAPRKSLATKEAILKAEPKRPPASVDAIIAAIPDARATPIYPNYAQWSDTLGTQFIEPLFRGEGSAVDLAKKVRPQLEDSLPK